MRARPILLPIATLILALAAVRAPAQESRPGGIHAFEMRRIDGTMQKLGDWRGKVVLIVNVASECGYTPQYEGLQALHRTYAPRGFAVLGFPSNDFGGQEPGSDQEIFEFCRQRYNVDFPLFSKVKVAGADAAPLYRYLQEDNPNKATVKWNFHKFLVGPDGIPIAAFGAKVKPDDAGLVAAIERALGGTPADSRAAARGLALSIKAFDGLKLADGSAFSIAKEAEKRAAALKAGRAYEPSPGIRWHWRRAAAKDAAERARIRAARDERPLEFLSEGDFVYYDPEFWEPAPGRTGFTEADLSDARAGSEANDRTVLMSVKPERRAEFGRYTAKWANQSIAIVLDGEVVMSAVIRGPIESEVVVSSPDLSEEEARALVERIGPPK
jgi:glutathione peroxidase